MHKMECTSSVRGLLKTNMFLESGVGGHMHNTIDTEYVSACNAGDNLVFNFLFSMSLCPVQHMCNNFLNACKNV